MCVLCLKIAFVSLLILIILFTTLSYVGVYITYIGIPLVLICGGISLSGFCKSKIKNFLDNL